VSRLLRLNGSMGFFWTVHVQLYDQIHNEIRSIYQRYAPHLDDAIKARPDEVISERRRLTENNNLFENIIVKEYSWMDVYTTDDYISLLNTHSKHQQLTEDIRNQLFYELRNIIDMNGGFINKQQMVALFLGKKFSV